MPMWNRVDRTTRHKGQTLELKVLDVIMCYFLGLSIQVIIDLCSPFNYYYFISQIFFFFALQNKDFKIMYLCFLFFSKIPLG